MLRKDRFSSLRAGVVAAGLQALGLLQGLLQREALVHSMNDCFLLILLVAGGCVGLAMLLRTSDITDAGWAV